MRRLSIGAGLCVLALVAGCVAVSWPSDSRLVPRNGGHPVGNERWTWLYLGFAIGAFVSYAAGLWLLRRSGGRLVLVGAIAAVHGGNPYVQHPADYPADPAYGWAGTGWRDTSSVYGPAFTLASEPLAL